MNERLKEIRLKLGKSQKAMAALLKISFKAWQGYETGQNVPGGTVMQSIALLGFNVNWVLTGEGPVYAQEAARVEQPEGAQGEFVFVPMMQGRISAGGGLIPDNNISLTVAFRKDWIRRKGDHRSMSMIRVEGDSMAPTLLDGDMVLVDHNVKAVSASGGIYAITFGDEIMVKRIEKIFPSGQWEIRSDNPNYKSFIVEPSDVIINGKVIWYARSLER